MKFIKNLFTSSNNAIETSPREIAGGDNYQEILGKMVKTAKKTQEIQEVFSRVQPWEDDSVDARLYGASPVTRVTVGYSENLYMVYITVDSQHSEDSKAIRAAQKDANNYYRAVASELSSAGATIVENSETKTELFKLATKANIDLAVIVRNGFDTEAEA